MLVSCCRLLVSPTVAEDPGAQISDFFFFGLQIEGAAGALDCEVLIALVVEHLAQLTINQGSLVTGDVATPEINYACLEVGCRSRVDHRLPNFANVAQLRDTLGVEGRASRCGSWRLGTLGGIGAREARLWQSTPPFNRRRMYSRAYICSNWAEPPIMRVDLSKSSQICIRNSSKFVYFQYTAKTMLINFTEIIKNASNL